MFSEHSDTPCLDDDLLGSSLQLPLPAKIYQIQLYSLIIMKTNHKEKVIFIVQSPY